MFSFSFERALDKFNILPLFFKKKGNKNKNENEFFIPVEA